MDSCIIGGNASSLRRRWFVSKGRTSFCKNLGFEQRPTSDDVLLVGIEGPADQIKIYIHPVEVKIGQNSPTVLSKANTQVRNTYEGLWTALWPEEGRNTLERKLSRNFFVQLLLVCCEKMKLYDIYPNEEWDNVLDLYRENLLNENYVFSNAMDQYIGKGTIVSFGTDVLNIAGKIANDVCTLEFPEKWVPLIWCFRLRKLRKA